MKVFVGADHRGYELKRKVLYWLKKWEYKVEDQGAYEYDRSDDYTIFAEKVGSLVSDQPASRGILICGSGVGVSVVANKFDGIRAAVGFTKDQVKSARAHDDMNILALSSDHTSEGEVKAIVKAFLKTKFSAKSRYKKRLTDIDRIEANN